jgi:hypothetical protein
VALSLGPATEMLAARLPGLTKLPSCRPGADRLEIEPGGLAAAKRKSAKMPMWGRHPRASRQTGEGISHPGRQDALSIAAYAQFGVHRSADASTIFATSVAALVGGSVLAAQQPDRLRHTPQSRLWRYEESAKMPLWGRHPRASWQAGAKPFFPPAKICASM